MHFLKEHPLATLLLSLFVGEIVSIIANDVEVKLIFTAQALPETLIGFVLGLLIFICFEVYHLRVDIIENNKTTGINNRLLTTVNNRTDHLDKYGQIVSRLYGNEEIIRDSGMTALMKFIDSFVVKDGSVSFIGEKISLDSFEVLWGNMIRASAKTNETVRVYACLLYTSRAHETKANLVCRLLLEKKNNKHNIKIH